MTKTIQINARSVTLESMAAFLGAAKKFHEAGWNAVPIHPKFFETEEGREHIKRMISEDPDCVRDMEGKALTADDVDNIAANLPDPYDATRIEIVG